MKLFLDDELINQEYYMSLTNDNVLFTDTFYLGSTSCNTFTIKIDKKRIKFTEIPKTAVLKNNNDIVIATLEVDKCIEDDVGYILTLVDKMVDLEFFYDASNLINSKENKKVSLLEILDDICQQAKITHNITKLENEIDVSWYDNTITAREYVGYIAELQAGYAYITSDGKLTISKHKKNIVKEIAFDEIGDYKIGDLHKISRVVYEFGTLKYEFGEDVNDTLYIRPDNPFIINENQIKYIYNNIVDFEFYSFITNRSKIYYDEVRSGDVIAFVNGEKKFSTIAQYSLSYYGGWAGGYSLDIKSTKQEVTKNIGLEERYKRLRITVDRNLNLIKQTV